MAVSKVGWVDRAWARSWARFVRALLNLDVANGEFGPVALARAAVVPQPRSIAAPVRDNECHVVVHVVAHVVQVRAIGSHGLCFSILAERGREG